MIQNGLRFSKKDSRPSFPSGCSTHSLNNSAAFCMFIEACFETKLFVIAKAFGEHLFNFDLSNSSVMSGSLEGQITCEPCSSECEKIKRKINNRKLSEIEKDEALDILTPFK